MSPCSMWGWHPQQGRTPSPWGDVPAPRAPPHSLVPPRPRRRAGSWAGAIFSPSAPDDAGGFFGSEEPPPAARAEPVWLPAGAADKPRRPQSPPGQGWGPPQHPKNPSRNRAGDGGSVPLPPCRRQLPGNAAQAGLAPWVQLPPLSPPQHLERSLMSMKCPSEQIAIELNLHQPPAFKSSYFELPSAGTNNLLPNTIRQQQLQPLANGVEKNPSAAGGRGSGERRASLSIPEHPASPPGWSRIHRTGPRLWMDP